LKIISKTKYKLNYWIFVVGQTHTKSSVNTGGKEEVLEYRRNLNLAQVDEQLVVLFLASTVDYQVCAERKNSRRYDC